MVAVVRGERSQANPRSKTAAPRGGPSGRRASPAREPRAPSRPSPPESSGLQPRLALAIGAVVILGGAIAGLVFARQDQPARAASQAAAPAAPASPLARTLAPLGFRLERVEVQGAPPLAKADILRAAALTKNTPILDLDLGALRARIEATGWVKEARVVRLLPDTLVVAVTPRTPAVVWQHLGQTRVVDAEGRLIKEADAARFPDLPLVVGEGAAEEAQAILPLLRQRPNLMSRVDAMVRVDGRRWDLRLKDGSLVQLPAVGEDSALIQLDQLDQKQRLLSLGFERVDLRNPEMVVVRPKPPASGAAGQAAAGSLNKP